MTLYQFNLLSDKQQAESLSIYGVQVAERLDGETKYILYQLDSFYIEGEIDTRHDHVISIRSFLSDKPLEPYLKNILLPS